MNFRSLTLEEQFFQKPIYISPLDLTQGGIVPKIGENQMQVPQLDKPQFFSNSTNKKLMNHFSDNWGWYVGFFIAGMVVANYIIINQQKQQEKNKAIN